MSPPRVLSASDPANVLSVARVLRLGGVAVVPTDTVYGLAASVFQADAVNRVFEIKKRRPEARVPILISSAADLPVLVQDIPRIAWKLIDRFWPGALTIVFSAKRGVPAWITRGGDSVAIRVPAGRSILEILQVLGEPIVGTSANLSGRQAAVTAEQVVAQLGGCADAILEDDRAVQKGLASTIVDVTGEVPVIHRAGAVSADHVREAIGARVLVRDELTTLARRH